LRTYGIALLALTVGTVTVLFVPPLFGRGLNAFPGLAEGRMYSWFAFFTAYCGPDLARRIGHSGILILVAIASERIINRNCGPDSSETCWVSRSMSALPNTWPDRFRIASDLALVQDGFSGTLLNFLRHSMFTIGSICALLYIDPKLTLVAFAGVGMFGGLIVYFI